MGAGDVDHFQKGGRDLHESVNGVDIYVTVTPDRLKLDPLVGMVRDDGAGAIATFSGVTRDTFNGKRVLRLEYEAYEPMAVKRMAVSMHAVWPAISVSASWSVFKAVYRTRILLESAWIAAWQCCVWAMARARREPVLGPAMQEICREAAAKWCLRKILVAHRTGEVGIGQPSVIIATSSEHRADALQVRC